MNQDRIPSTQIVLLQKTGRRNVIWKYLSGLGGSITLSQTPKTIFKVYSAPDGILLGLSGPSSKTLWLKTTYNPDSPFTLTHNIEEALHLNVSTSIPVSGSGLQIDLSSITQDIQNAVAMSGSFGLILIFSEKIFTDLQTPGTKTNMVVGTGTFNPDIISQGECESINGYWDPSSGCYTCLLGAQYPDRTNLTCIDCPLGASCGSHGGYCDGDTGNPQVPCVEDTTTQKFVPACTPGVGCGGQCSGGCGAGAAFGKTCQLDPITGTYQCKFDKSKWWVILLWIIFFLLVIALVAFLVWRFLIRKPTPAVIKNPTGVTVTNPVQPTTGYQPTGYPGVSEPIFPGSQLPMSPPLQMSGPGLGMGSINESLPVI